MRTASIYTRSRSVEAGPWPFEAMPDGLRHTGQQLQSTQGTDTTIWTLPGESPEGLSLTKSDHQNETL